MVTTDVHDGNFKPVLLYTTVMSFKSDKNTNMVKGHINPHHENMSVK